MKKILQDEAFVRLRICIRQNIVTFLHYHKYYKLLSKYIFYLPLYGTTTLYIVVMITLYRVIQF